MKHWTQQEESRLLALHGTFPNYTWEQLSSAYNDGLPAELHRSREGVKKKMRALLPLG